jgi:hypothetical protein
LKVLFQVISGLLVLSSWYTQAVDIVMSIPNAAVTLPIEGSKGSSFYIVDGERFNVIVAFTLSLHISRVDKRSASTRNGHSILVDALRLSTLRKGTLDFTSGEFQKQLKKIISPGFLEGQMSI